jgi:undecaprenyl-diphosphatase
MAISLLERLDERDRALFTRWAIGRSASRAIRGFWIALTHLGGFWSSAVGIAVPLLFAGPVRVAAMQALVTLVISHLVVQVLKRHVVRRRPSIKLDWECLISEPDRFSFPSGHACASMAVAVVFATSFPVLALPLLILSVAVGLSRVCLGVHYPSDVFVGQAIGLATAAAVLGAW